MPKTTPSESTNNNRFNPYITKSISKTLLTPCRQVGLSRKKKTPNSTVRSSSDVSVNDCSGSDTLNTTPVTSRQPSNESPSLSQEAEVQPKPVKNSDKVKTKKSVSKCLIADDDNKTASDKSVKSPDKMTVKKSDAKRAIIDDENEERVPLIGGNSKGPSERTVRSSSRGKVKKSVSKRLIIYDDDDDYAEKRPQKEENSGKTAPNRSIKSPDKLMKKSRSKRVIVDDEDEDSINLVPLKADDPKKQECESYNGVKVKKSVSKCPTIDSDDENEDDIKLALKTEKTPLKDVSAIDSDFDISPVIKPEKLRQYENKSKKMKTVLTEIQNESQSSVIVEKSKEKPTTKVQTQGENAQKPEKKVKMKRSLSLKKSNEEIEERKNLSNSEKSINRDCTIVLSPLKHSESIPDVPEINANDLSKLEKEVQEKRKFLEDLQQAEIYRKLHDVEKLQELTATWKSGCIAALNDLLPHLQAHANIDMATLLNNLRVPEKLITVSQNGDLI